MSIFYDPTEARKGSRLPKVVVDAGYPLQGLEFATGADFLLTPDGDVIEGDVTSPPTSFVFRRKMQEGCFLVQRKSGGDLLNSLKELRNILWRMRQNQGAVPWLLICGEFFRSSDGYVVVDGRKSGWNWKAMKGMTDAWQIMGGMLHDEYTDELCGEWLMSWEGSKLRKLLDDKNQGLQPKPIVPHADVIDATPQRTTLMTFPGVGDTLARQILEYCGGSLKSALWWMSLPSTHKQANAIAGIGPKKRQRWRGWYGLDDDETLIPLKDAQDLFLLKLRRDDGTDL